jgi:hypothetical protein
MEELVPSASATVVGLAVGDAGGSPGRAAWERHCSAESNLFAGGDVEVLPDNLLSPRQSVAAAYGED